MYILPNSQFQDEQEIVEFFYGSSHPERYEASVDHSMKSPYQLVFSTLTPDFESSYYRICYLAPPGGFYSALSKEEALKKIAPVKLHRHSFYELMFVLSGEIYVNIENRRHLYPAGSCCILNKNVLHAEEYTTASRIVFLELSEELLLEVFRNMTLNYFSCEKDTAPCELLDFFRLNLSENDSVSKNYLDFVPLNASGPAAKQVHTIFDSLTHTTINPVVGSSFQILSLLVSLFMLLSDPLSFSTTSVQIGSEKEYAIYSRILVLMERSHGRITRSKLSEQLNYSGAYLNEISKKYSGLSLFDFGMTFCMKEAGRRLATGKETIDEIGISLGFTNRSHFYKIFKETYHMTPAAYRKSRTT